MEYNYWLHMTEALTPGCDIQRVNTYVCGKRTRPACG
jgi:hypothetical protein